MHDGVSGNCPECCQRYMRMKLIRFQRLPKLTRFLEDYSSGRLAILLCVCKDIEVGYDSLSLRP